MSNKQTLSEVESYDRELNALVDKLMEIFSPGTLPSDKILLADMWALQFVPKPERKRILRKAKKIYPHRIAEERVELIQSHCESDVEMAEVELQSFRSDVNNIPYLTKAERRGWIIKAELVVKECLADNIE